MGKVCPDSFLRLKQTFSRVYCFDFRFPNVEIEMFSSDFGTNSKIL